MLTIYKTVQGDTWDIISKKFYKKETFVNKLILANPTLAQQVFFSANVSIKIPDIDTTEVSENPACPWR